MPPRPDNAARTHRPRGPSGAARGCEALLRPENHRVFRIIITHPRLRIDGKRDTLYGPAGKVRDQLAAWYAAGVNTPVLVPSSVNGNQLTALDEIFAAFSR